MFEKRVAVDDDRYRPRVPSLPNPFNADYGVGLRFIVESERKRPCELTRFFEIGKWRSGGKGNGVSGQVRLNVEIRSTVGSGYLNVVPLLSRAHSELGALIVVVSEKISKQLH